jgi:hypothetical protein
VEVQYFASIVALGVGLVAIFTPYIRVFVWPPALSISFNVTPPDSHPTVRVDTIGKGNTRREKESNCYWYRLRIDNDGPGQARNVQVFLSKEEDQSFLPMNLKWAHIGEVTRKSIAPGLFAYCDFGSIISSEDAKEIYPSHRKLFGGNAVLDLCLEKKPNTGSHLVKPPGPHHFDVTVTSDSISPFIRRKFTYVVDFEDIWKLDDKGEPIGTLRVEEK